jgi:membrane-bound serine protease (ClpP class)
MKTVIVTLLISMVSVLAQAECTLAIHIKGAITAATRDYFQRAEVEAQRRNCHSLLVRINTPGGDLQSTRMIVEKILDSKVPYLCLITPSGGHAGSAGAIIIQACHVSGGLAATNVGAATPILGSGMNLPEDLRKKVFNDTVSWVQSLAALRGRNADFAKEIVTEATAVSSEEAVKNGALDILARDEKDFLEKSLQRKTQIRNEKNQAITVGEVQEYETDLRYQILSFVADPELAYLLFMVSIGLLYFEITHPGFIAPGVFGSVGLVLSLIAFQKLEVQWGGFALIILGLGFLVAELFVTSFGVLGVGGLISLIVGSLFLYNPESTGYTLPWALILSVSLCLGAFFIGLGFLALKTARRKKQDWDTEMIGKSARIVRTESGREGQLEIQGETWSYQSEDLLKIEDRVEIIGRQGLVLRVRKK